MNTSSVNVVKEETENATASASLFPGVCGLPALGELLPDYIAGLLADSVAEEVEEHLLDCLDCRSKHLKILGIAEALCQCDVNQPEPAVSAKVLKMPDFKDRTL